MNALEKARSLVGEIRSAREPLKLIDQWALAGRLLGRFPVDQAELARVVRDRDVEALDRIVSGLENPAAANPGAAKEDGGSGIGNASGGTDPVPAFTDDELDHAYRAFKKRLKVMRLADESKLGGRYTSGGKTSKIDAIEPPTELPREVWKALVRAGKLRDTGQGFYAIAD